MNAFENVFVKIGHGVAWPFEHGVKLLQLLDESLKDEPKVKELVTGLITQVAIVSGEGAIVVQGKGLDLPADLAELAAAKTLWAYIVGTFLPGIRAVYGDLAPIVDDLTAQNTVPAAPATSALSGPGLHTVVAA
jgi:hypothetical protein